MSICRPIAVFALSVALLSGCAAEKLPPYDAAAGGGQAGKDWLPFLPVSEVLSGDAGDFRRAGVEVATLKARVRRLRGRAAVLRAQP